jgi:hypothetical protein
MKRIYNNMLHTVKSFLSVGAGCVTVAAFSHLIHVDWQFMFVALYDATYGRCIPTIEILLADRA